jgi:hypothetical protein
MFKLREYLSMFQLDIQVEIVTEICVDIQMDVEIQKDINRGSWHAQERCKHRLQARTGTLICCNV